MIFVSTLVTIPSFRLFLFIEPFLAEQLYVFSDEKVERFSLSRESSVCLESAKALYLICEEHMTKLSVRDVIEKPVLSVTAQANIKSGSLQSRTSKKAKGNSKSIFALGSKSQKNADKKKEEASPLTIADYSFNGGEALLKRLGNVNNELGKMFENKLLDGIVRLNGLYEKIFDCPNPVNRGCTYFNVYV